MSVATIIPIARLNFRLVEWQWPFANDRRAEIASYFDALKRKNASLWNGRVFLLRNYYLSDACLSGDFFEVDFADLLAWRDWGFPDRSIYSCFAMAAVEGANRNFLLGQMDQHTANAGFTCFPTGTPDVHDLDGDRVDLDKSVSRELAEETGLEVDQFQAEPGWHAVFSGQHIALIKWLRTPEDAEIIRARVIAVLARQTQPEFADICIVRGRDDLTPAVPAYVRAFLERAWHD